MLNICVYWCVCVCASTQKFQYYGDLMAAPYDVFFLWSQELHMFHILQPCHSDMFVCVCSMLYIYVRNILFVCVCAVFLNFIGTVGLQQKILPLDATYTINYLFGF